MNNRSELERIYEKVKLDLPWIETQSITSSKPVNINDVNNDIERELEFYRQALEGVIEGRKKVIASGASFTRPDDYFAEMIKSDEHMRKVRGKLINEEQKIKASENARRQRELKKFGKKVQVEKLQERQKKRKETLEKIKVIRKKRKNTKDKASFEDEFE